MLKFIYILTVAQLSYPYIYTGGILGLLTGMSFLSLFEIIFWLLRLPPNKKNESQHSRKVHERQSMEVRKTERSFPHTGSKEIQNKP